MSTRRATAWVVAAGVILLGALGPGCGDDDDDDQAAAGAAGSAGKGGSAAAGGAGASAGAAGSGGGAGVSGSSGQAGAGPGGTAGVAGASGGSGQSGGPGGSGPAAGSGGGSAFAGPLYLAGGQDLRRVSSTDGKTWGHDVYIASNGLDNAFGCFAFGKGLAVAAGNSGVYTTKDGITWTPTGSDPGKEAMHACAAVFDGEHFTIITGDRTFRSSDGLTWTKTSDPATGATHWSGLAFGNGRYLAFGDSNSAGVTSKVSDDGTTWHDFVLDAANPGLRSAVYAGGQFVAVGQKGRHATSKDGLTWENDKSEGPDFDGDLGSIAYGNDVFVAMGCCGAATSTDGITWVRRQGGVNGSVAFAGGLFVGAGWYASIASSPDGITWTSVYDGKKPNQFDATKDAPWFTAVGAGVITP